MFLYPQCDQICFLKIFLFRWTRTSVNNLSIQMETNILNWLVCCSTSFNDIIMTNKYCTENLSVLQKFEVASLFIVEIVDCNWWDTRLGDCMQQVFSFLRHKTFEAGLLTCYVNVNKILICFFSIDIKKTANWWQGWSQLCRMQVFCLVKDTYYILQTIHQHHITCLSFPPRILINGRMTSEDNAVLELVHMIEYC